MKKDNTVLNILMDRDNMTEDEAISLIAETNEMLNETIMIGDFDHAEDIMREQLGLEMDYVECVLSFS